MREIKFRAWKDGKMYPVSLLELPIQMNMGSLMQYTGWMDGEGREVYEGDILCFVPIGHPKFNKPYQPFAISWMEDAGRWIDWSPKTGKGAAVIIGNIYENPELLERNT